MDESDSVSNQWPFPYRDARNSSCNPDATLREEPSEQWRVETPGWKSPPCVLEEIIFLCIETATGTVVSGFDRETGTRRWTRDCDDFPHPFAIGGVTGCLEKGELRLLEPSSGDPRGRYELPDETRGMTTDGDSIFTFGESVGRIDIEQGETVWRTAVDLGTDGAHPGTVAVGAEALYVAYGETVTAVDKETGTVSWNYEADGIVSEPTVTEDSVYVTGFGGSVSAIDPVTGDEQWSFDTKTWVEGTVATDSERVYLGGTNGYLIALNRTDGSAEWAFETQGDADTSPVIAGDTVIVATVEGYLHGVDRTTGTPRWQLERDRQAYSPAVVDDELYATTAVSVFLFRSESTE